MAAEIDGKQTTGVVAIECLSRDSGNVAVGGNCIAVLVRELGQSVKKGQTVAVVSK